jgi:hypothetical protein
LCATSFACGFFGSLWRVEENHGLLTLGESKNENRAFFCRHRETGTRAICETFEEKDHSRRAVRVTIEAPGARAAFGGASRRTVGSCAFPVARTRARAHVARAREHTALSVVRATAKRGARVQP